MPKNQYLGGKGYAIAMVVVCLGFGLLLAWAGR